MRGRGALRLGGTHWTHHRGPARARTAPLDAAHPRPAAVPIPLPPLRGGGCEFRPRPHGNEWRHEGRAAGGGREALKASAAARLTAPGGGSAGARLRAAGPLGAGPVGGDLSVPAPGASDLSGERGAAQVTRPGLQDPVSTRTLALAAAPGGSLGRPCWPAGGAGREPCWVWRGRAPAGRVGTVLQNPELSLPERAGVDSSCVALGKFT